MLITYIDIFDIYFIVIFLRFLIFFCIIMYLYTFIHYTMKKLVWIVLWVLCFSFASAEYTQDYGTAYNWAYKNWIVSETSFSAANLYSAISRVEFSSMLMGFAKNVLKMKDPVTTTCSFIDIESLNWGYKNAALWACERWIMGLGTNVFKPNDSLTLADFWTTLSRLFWWEKFSDWIPYYLNHLWALKSIWAVNDISDPLWVLMKWDVLVMLMNSIQTIDFSAGPNAPATDTYVHNAAGPKPTPVYYDPNAYSHSAAGPRPNISYVDYYWNTYSNNYTYTYDYNDRVSNCYRLVDNCRNSSINSDIACEYVCCDENGFWVRSETSGNCAPRPGYWVTTVAPITATSTGNVVTTTTTATTGTITTTSTGSAVTTTITSSTGTVTTSTTTTGNVDTSDVKTNCWLQSTDSEDVEECGRCLWLKNYSEESIKFWAEKNDPLLLDCPVYSDECKARRFSYDYPGSKTANQFHSLVLDLSGRDVNKSADKWLKETFKEDEVKFIYKCEQQRYETFKSKKKAEILES